MGPGRALQSHSTAEILRLWLVRLNRYVPKSVPDEAPGVAIRMQLHSTGGGCVQLLALVFLHR